MGTKQFNDKTTHRQQAKHSVKTKVKVRMEMENRTFPGLFHFSRAQNFFPNL